VGLTKGVMVSLLTSSVVDCGLTKGVMVSLLTSSVVDCGFDQRCNGLLA
jgi:uncharacterized protein YwbE